VLCFAGDRKMAGMTKTRQDADFSTGWFLVRREQVGPLNNYETPYPLVCYLKGEKRICYGR
jgi:hypothetical protein